MHYPDSTRPNRNHIQIHLRTQAQTWERIANKLKKLKLTVRHLSFRFHVPNFYYENEFWFGPVGLVRISDLGASDPLTLNLTEPYLCHKMSYISRTMLIFQTCSKTEVTHHNHELDAQIDNICEKCESPSSPTEPNQNYKSSSKCEPGNPKLEPDRFYTSR